MFKTKQLLNVFKLWCEWGISERFYFRHMLRASRDGSVAKPRSMLNIAIFDPWQRSLFSRQRTLGKEPLLGGKSETNFGTQFQLTLLSLYAGLVKKCFLLGGGGGGWSGRLFEGGRLLTFWTFRVGVYSRWALIRRWAVNRINTVLKN